MPEFIVITGIPDMDDPDAAVGNLAAALGSVWVPILDLAALEGQPMRFDRMEKADPNGFTLALNLRVAVFNVGEVLICQDGREIPYPGRKPSKWDVRYETFTDLDEALRCAAEVSV